jgi:Zn-dependent protease/predicted transcriptional regulator
MFGRPVTLFRLFGFEVKIDVSWLIIAALITWSLASSVFPTYFTGLASSTYWAMGVAGAVGLFLSVIIHEFSHSLVARRFGLSMKGITLFIFGGVAEMAEEPPSAKAEFVMAVAGPGASVVLSGILYGITVLAGVGGWPGPVIGVLSYLWVINLVLAAFNLLPAFPLDGGRVLRSLLWGYSKRLTWATRIASRTGSGFGFALMIVGVLFFIRGDLVGGIWWFLIGLFVRNASIGSYQQLLTKQVLAGHPVRQFMEENPITVPYQISIEQLVEDYVYKHHFKMFPVLEGGQLVGCITIGQIKAFPRSEWDQHTVRELSSDCTPENTISPDTDASEALAQMHRTRHSRLMVVEGDELVGIITLKDLLEFLSLKLDLEGREPSGRG